MAKTGTAKAKAATAHATEMGAAAFKAHCLELIDQVNLTRQAIVVTKRGQPLARLVPYAEEAPRLYGALKGLMTIKGDIVSPLFPGWDAEL